MSRNQAVGISLVAAFLWTTLLPAAASAQQSSSGIAGVVRDASGGVLPGVTVEAASPVLIEKVRSVVTDGEGRYNIVDLRPGTYVVTFTLLGFNTFRREGITLTASFTATVNADMQVGALEETITVTGAAPLVDTQNTRQQRVVSNELLDTLPTSNKAIQNLINLAPGVTGGIDVGGASGTYASQGNSLRARGKAQDAKFQFDGMQIENMQSGGGSAGYIMNSAMVEEMTMEMGGVTAESIAAGVAVNSIPKEGSNLFRFSTKGMFTNDNLQSDNLDDKLRARGLSTVDTVLHIYDVSTTVGGPIKRDKLWFFGAARVWGNRNVIAGRFWNKTQGTPFYTEDLDRPADRYEYYRSGGGRLTWQASQRNKFNFFVDVQNNYVYRRAGVEAPEAKIGWHFSPQGLYQASWSSPLTGKLLLEGGASFVISHWPNFTQPGVGPNDISINDTGTGIRYNAPQSGYSYANPRDSDRYTQRFAVSYVTGSHAFKVGIQTGHGIRNSGFLTPGGSNISYRFLNGVPNQVEQYTTPFLEKLRMKLDLGIYAQDQWTINRLTFNYGLRFDYLHSYLPAHDLPATTFVGARHFDALYGMPEWTDLNPRLGGSYDLFGNGRTAIKVSLGRFVDKEALDLLNEGNPIKTTVNTVTRTWDDANKNYLPDCDLHSKAQNGECGPFSNQNFGGNDITTIFADDLVRGFGNRNNTWDLATEVQHQLFPGMSMTAGYYRNWDSNFRVADNTEVVPEDFSPFCVTAPSDPRLPGGGGYQVCGLYDVKPALFGKSFTLATKDSNYGKQTRANNFVGLNVNTRFPSGIQIGGGVESGRTVADNCFVIDSPQQLLNCRVITPWAANTQIKLHGVYPLPAGISVSAVFQNQAGPAITASYAAPNAQIAPTLLRNLAACGTRAVCTSTATVPLIAPNTLFEDRTNQLDLRLTKTFRMGSTARLQGNFDLYNLLNSNAVLAINTTYGAQWLQPSRILDGRLIQVSAQLTF